MKIKPMNRFLLAILPGNVTGITLYPFGVYLRYGKSTIETITHEHIHWKQQQEMLIIGFYLWYVLEWLVRLVKNGKYAYYNISFEIEAYRNSGEEIYPFLRKHFAWIKYL